MKGPGILTMMVVMSIAIMASASASPRAGNRDAFSLFGHKTAKAACSLGTHYSSFYKECVHGVTQVSTR